MNCPKCGNDLPKEATFCPYCMTKFGEVVDMNQDKMPSRRNNKKLVIALFAAIVAICLIIAVVLFVNESDKDTKFDEVEQEETQKDNQEENQKEPQEENDAGDNNEPSDDTSTDKENVENEPSENKPVENEVDYKDYCGTWYNKDFEGQDPEVEGGNVLKIVSANKDKVIFDLASHQSPPGMRVAEIMSVEADIIDGKAEFIFGDDGWGNGGIGVITFADGKVSVNIKLTTVSTESLWQLNVDTEFKKASDGYQNDTVDFLGTLGNDISVIKEKLNYVGIELSKEDDLWIWEGLMVKESANGVESVYVDFTLMPEGYRDMFNVSSGINGDSDYDYVEKRFGKPVETKDADFFYVSTFAVPEENSLLDMAYIDGNVMYMRYYEVTE